MDIPPSLLQLSTDASAPPSHPHLPSLTPFLLSLQALLSSPFPPRSIYIHATSNANLLPSILQACLNGTEGSSDDDDDSEDGEEEGHADPRDTLQRALPRSVSVDCAELASSKALFGRILNGLAGWDTAQAWDEELGGAHNWDGRQGGCSVAPSSASTARSRATRRSSATVQWDYDAARDAPQVTGKGIMGERKDESLSGFLDGLRSVFSLGDTATTLSSAQRTGRPRERPRFVVLHNAERLPGLESLPAGQGDGTLLASFMRLRELTGKPIVPILVSSSEWLLLRPTRGATEPAASLSMPALSRRDLLSFLPAYLSPALLSPNRCPTELGQQTLSQLLASLLDLIVQTFSTYVSYEVSEHVYLAERLWPTWVGRVARGDVASEDSGRMVALLKGDLAREIDNLAELRPLAGTPPAPEQRGAISDGTRSPSKMRMTMTAGTSTATTPTKVPPLPGFASPSFCFPSVTPSKRAHPGTSTGTTSTNPSLTLTLSLPLLSRYILIAAFLCSSNPSKKDLLMVATGDEDVFSARKKKKGGGTRKTPQRPGGGAKKDAVPQRLLGPKPFAVERLCAVTEAILPVELRSLARGPDMFQEIATLTNLRLLVKTSSSASAAAASGSVAVAVSAFDKLEGIKLKCSTSLELELIESIGKSVDFKVSERLWEAL